MARDLTVRLAEDRPGALAAVVQALTGAGVNIEGIAEIEGVVHVVGRDPRAVRMALRDGGFAIDSELEVLMVQMPDRPGELAMIMHRLAEANVNLRFLYMASETRVVIGVDDITQARTILSQRRTS
jgi:hypothetical protein